MRLTLKPVSVWGILFLLLPFLLCGYVLLEGAAKISGTEYRFSIQGFDPRDILRGHYMVFQYQWPEPHPLCPVGDDCALCVSGDPLKPVVSVYSPNRECPNIWYMEYNSIGLQNAPQPQSTQSQYYIPELEAPALEELLRTNPEQFSVGVVIKNGKAAVKNLYINNIPLKTYLKL